MKTKIIAFGILTGFMTWVVAQTPPPGAGTGKIPIRTPTGEPAVNPKGKSPVIPVSGSRGNPDIPSPNDDRINQMTPDITNYANGWASNDNAHYYPSNRNGGCFGPNGIYPGGKTNHWSNPKTNWPDLRTNRHHWWRR